MSKWIKITVTAFLAIIWVILSYVMLTAERLTLRTILIVAMSGIIVFVPLWKKLFHESSNK